MMVTVDANIFVSAFRQSELQHKDSDLFLNRIVQKGLGIYCPTLVLPETAAAIVRPTGNVMLAQRVITQIEQFPGMSLQPLTHLRSLTSAHLTIHYRLRGADAVYVAVAQEFGTMLVTWDTEMLTRGGLAVPTMTPTGWLAANPV